MNKFNIYPAIDIKDGKCVRLVHGDFIQETIYSNNPLEQISLFVNKGIKWVHIVDLNAALNKKSNKPIILKLLQNFHERINIQLGGGIRSSEDIKFWIDNGVKRVVVSTMAYKNPESINNINKDYYRKIAIGIDVRGKKMSVDGWKTDLNDVDPREVINKINPFILDAIIYTDITKDGTLKGANIKDTIKFSSSVKLPIIVSGGVSSFDEIKKIRSLEKKGIIGVIVGKALYEKKISLNQLIKIC